MNNQAVTPLTATPIAATTMTVTAAIGSGADSRIAASHASDPMASSRTTALMKLAMIVARLSP